jgi:hypothetical protein
VTVQGSALRMTWQKMSTVGVLCHTKLHGVRIAHGREEGTVAALVSETAATAEV